MYDPLSGTPTLPTRVVTGQGNKSVLEQGFPLVPVPTFHVKTVIPWPRG